MIRYKYGVCEREADCLETAVRSVIQTESWLTDGQLERVEHRVFVLEGLVAGLLAKLSAEEALEMLDCVFISESRP